MRMVIQLSTLWRRDAQTAGHPADLLTRAGRRAMIRAGNGFDLVHSKRLTLGGFCVSGDELSASPVGGVRIELGYAQEFEVV